jgi:hypothetical protein
VLPSNASPRGGVTGHRFWRARRGSLLRSRKGSVAEEGILTLPKRSPFARRFPRWVSAGEKKREVLQTSRRFEPVTRVPEASKRRARANRSKNARLAFTPALRPAVRLVHASGTRRRKPSRADRGSLVLDAATHRVANATGIGWCRRAAGRKLRSRARIGRSKGVPARRDRLQKSASDVESPG